MPPSSHRRRRGRRRWWLQRRRAGSSLIRPPTTPASRPSSSGTRRHQRRRRSARRRRRSATTIREQIDQIREDAGRDRGHQGTGASRCGQTRGPTSTSHGREADSRGAPQQRIDGSSTTSNSASIVDLAPVAAGVAELDPGRDPDAVGKVELCRVRRPLDERDRVGTQVVVEQPRLLVAEPSPAGRGRGARRRRPRGSGARR